MYKTLAKSIRQYKKPVYLTMLMMAFEVLAEILIPFLMAKVLDTGLENQNVHYVLKIGIIMFLIACFSMTFGIIGGRTSATAAVGFSSNLRQDIFENIQTFSFQNIDKYSSSSLITRLTTDITNIQMAFQMVMKTIIRAPFMIVFAFIMASYTNLKLSLTIVLIIPILGGVLVWLIYKVHPYFIEVFKKYDRLNRTVQEDINGVRVVKSFVREEMEVKKFEVASEDIKRNFMTAEKIIALNSPIMQLAVYTTLLLVYWFGAKYVVAGTMEVGELVSFITYMMLILTSLMMISMIFVMIVISEASVERVSEILNEKATITNPTNPITTIEDGSIEFKQVSFTYSKTSEEDDLYDINLTIKSGEQIGIIGGTGSGKSTLIQLIPRLYDVTKGEVIVAGHNVKEYDLVTLRNQIAMVLQKNTLFSGTIDNNLRWGNQEATDAQIHHVAQLAQASEFVDTFPEKYETMLDQGGNNVSGGQKQRLTIARALLKSPKILILDDSTSAVDTKTDAMIQKAFSKEIPNTTKIIVSQRISSIQTSDRIIVMDEGRINGIGTHDELLKTNSIYQEVYQSQIKGGADDEND